MIKFRGELSDSRKYPNKMVDILGFEKDIVKSKDGKEYKIKDFNCIYVPTDTFIEIMNLDVEIKKEKVKQIKISK